MIRHLFLFLGLIASVFISQAQQKTAKISIQDHRNQEGGFDFFSFGVESFLYPSSYFSEHNNYKLQDGKLTKEFKLEGLSAILLSGNNFQRTVFLSPGDNLKLELSQLEGKDTVIVTGKGAENNQYFPLRLFMSSQDYRKDSLPDRVLAAIDVLDKQQRDSWAGYMKKYKPSKAMQELMVQHLTYTKVKLFYNFWGNQKYAVRRLATAEQLFPIWKAKNDSLLALHPLDNAKALNSPSYRLLIADYLLRKKEEIWENIQNPDVLQAYYPELSRDEALAEYAADSQNLLQERLLNRTFTGKVNEYAYALLLRNIMEGKKTSAIKVIEHFESKYPKSVYHQVFAPMITQVKVDSKRVFDPNKMIFVAGSEQFDNFDQVLAAFRGKTVLIDLWGTWCAPCHQEIQKNSGPLKEHFANKDVTFLYIANYDVGKDQLLKELIAYYDLAGQHINASKELTDDMMAKTKASGFPSYILIKKNGEYALSKSGYPMDRSVLIQEIEQDLK